MNDQNHSVPLPLEFLDGPWITGEELMEWLDLSKERLKTMRFRGLLGYSDRLGVIMYNKPWIQQKLAEGWKINPYRKRNRKKKEGDEDKVKE